MRSIRKGLPGSAAIAALFGGATIAMAQGGPEGFAGQVERGRSAYAQNCAACHGETLAGGQFATALKGPAFLAKWGSESATVADLYRYIRTSMPPARAGALPDETYAALAALIVHENEATSPEPLPAEEEALAAFTLPPPPAAVRGEIGVGGLSQRYPLPPGPEIADRFADYTPVTQEMLANPAPENWLTWRRAHNGRPVKERRAIVCGRRLRSRVASWWRCSAAAISACCEPVASTSAVRCT